MNQNIEYPFFVTGADGNIVWNGIGYMHDAVVVVNRDAAAFAAGQAIVHDTVGGKTYAQPWDRTQAAGAIRQEVAALLCDSDTSADQFIGVAIKSAAVATQCVVAGDGSVMPVKATAAGTVRQNCVASATAGSITAQDALPTAPAGVLGKVVKIAGATGGTTDSGSASYLVCAVNPK